MLLQSCKEEQAHDANSRATYAETLYCLAGWLRRTLQDTPKRSTLYIMTDLDDRMGVPIDLSFQL